MTTSQFPDVVQAIEAGSFPESQDTLAHHLTADDTAVLLEGLSRAKENLSAQIRQTSLRESGNIDGWIAQAKKLQHDIATCKQDAGHIVDEWVSNGSNTTPWLAEDAIFKSNTGLQ